MQLSERGSAISPTHFHFDQTMKLPTREKPSHCPWGGSTKIAFLLRGMPVFLPELESALDGGGLVIGSRVGGEEGPTWQCTECYAQFFRDRRDPP